MKKGRQALRSIGPSNLVGLDGINQMKWNLRTQPLHLVKPNRTPVGVFAKFVPQLRLLNDQNHALSAPDNMVGGAAMRTIPALSKAGFNHPEKG